MSDGLDQLKHRDVTIEEIALESPLVENYRDILNDRVPSGGGCCGATVAANEMRRD